MTGCGWLPKIFSGDLNRRISCGVRSGYWPSYLFTLARWCGQLCSMMERSDLCDVSSRLICALMFAASNLTALFKPADSRENYEILPTSLPATVKEYVEATSQVPLQLSSERSAWNAQAQGLRCFLRRSPPTDPSRKRGDFRSRTGKSSTVASSHQSIADA